MYHDAVTVVDVVAASVVGASVADSVAKIAVDVADDIVVAPAVGAATATVVSVAVGGVATATPP